MLYGIVVLIFRQTVLVECSDLLTIASCPCLPELQFLPVRVRTMLIVARGRAARFVAVLLLFGLHLLFLKNIVRVLMAVLPSRRPCFHCCSRLHRPPSWSMYPGFQRYRLYYVLVSYPLLTLSLEHENLKDSVSSVCLYFFSLTGSRSTTSLLMVSGKAYWLTRHKQACDIKVACMCITLNRQDSENAK